MIADLAILAIAITLAGGAYVFKRHTGTLMMVIMAATLVATSSTQTVTSWLQTRGVSVPLVSLDGVVMLGIILLPAILSWFVVPKGKGRIVRLLSAAALGLVVAAAISPVVPMIFDSSIVARATAATWLRQYEGAIMGAALCYAVVDMYLTKMHSHHDDPKKKK